jgi:hypothetical protein
VFARTARTMLRRSLLSSLRRAAAPVARSAAAPAFAPGCVRAWEAAAPSSLLPRSAAALRAPCAGARGFTGSAPSAAGGALPDVLNAELKHELEHYETPEARARLWLQTRCAGARPCNAGVR